MLQSSSVSVSSAKTRPWIRFAIAALLLTGSGVGYQVWRWQSAPVDTQTTAIQPLQVRTVTALGRLEPQGEVIQLSAPTANNGNRVEQLLVKAGDRVQAGQVIAILDSRDRLQAAFEQAQEEVKVAQAKLAITQAGAKQGEIEAQKANIARLEAQLRSETIERDAEIARVEAELRNAERTYQRYQSLYQEGAEKAVVADEKRERYETTLAQLNQARAQRETTVATLRQQIQQEQATLDRIAEVRPVDIRASQAEIDRAVAAMNQAKAELDKAYVRSPIAGEILDIHTHAGEVVGNDGIVEIGHTERMYAVAEVYQSDIGKVRSGQRVRITGDSIAGELQGTVEQIDSQVRRQTIVNTDPSANIDARVIEVHIALDAASSQRAAKFTNLQVTAVIEP